MLGLELVVVVGLTVLLGGVAAARVRLAPPVLMLAGGVVLGFLPAFRETHLSPEAVLFLFLPALLYWESLTTSWREIRSNLRGIVAMSTGLVVVTAGAVAALAHTFGLPWGPAWVLGAAVAPTDATAVAVLASALPRRNLTLLRAESLLNDGTALVIFAVAVAATVSGGQLSAPHIFRVFLLAYAGGIATGLVVAWLALRAGRLLSNPVLDNVASVLTPFAAYLVADLIGASGVLAVVAAGLMISQVGPRMARAATRQQSAAFWSLATYLLNGTLFVLVGIETHSAARGLPDTAIGSGLLAVLFVSIALVAVRLAWLFLTTYLIRLLDRRPQQRLRRVSNRARVLTGVAGFRGAVSLAAALAVPLVLDSGRPFPDRDLIVFVTSGVIVVTLVVQALLLPRVMRWAQLPIDAALGTERRLAETESARAGRTAAPTLAARLGTAPQVTARVTTEYDEHLRVLSADLDDTNEPRRQQQEYTALRLAVLDRERATVLRLRDEGRIDDTVLREAQVRLDIEEVRLSRHPTTE